MRRFNFRSGENAIGFDFEMVAKWEYLKNDWGKHTLTIWFKDGIPPLILNSADAEAVWADFEEYVDPPIE